LLRHAVHDPAGTGIKGRRSPLLDARQTTQNCR
jgi:hypothetical protein